MKRLAGPPFRECYDKLPEQIQDLADKNFALLKENPRLRVAPSPRLRIALGYQPLF
jgi:hypothetical protein